VACLLGSPLGTLQLFLEVDHPLDQPLHNESSTEEVQQGMGSMLQEAVSTLVVSPASVLLPLCRAERWGLGLPSGSSPASCGSTTSRSPCEIPSRGLALRQSRYLQPVLPRRRQSSRAHSGHCRWHAHCYLHHHPSGAVHVHLGSSRQKACNPKDGNLLLNIPAHCFYSTSGGTSISAAAWFVVASENPSGWAAYLPAAHINTAWFASESSTQPLPQVRQSCKAC
jgi:hypothetical protein